MLPFHIFTAIYLNLSQFIVKIILPVTGEKIRLVYSIMYVNSNCVGCSQCIVFCKHGAITAKGRAVISKICVECRVCISYCPMKALQPGQEV